MTRDELRLQHFLKILGDSTRFQIVLHLMQGEECVCDIGGHLGLEQTLVSHHLSTLRSVGLVQDRKVGTWVHCSLTPKTLKELETLFRSILGSENLATKRCASHDACRITPLQK